MKPKVTFIVLCYNNQKLLSECFESIVSQSYKNFNIIMVDNGSSDESVQFAQTNFPEIKIIEANKNLGFAGGNNLGIEEAFKNQSVEYVALLNTDARVDINWLTSLVEFAAKNPKGAGFQGLTLNYFDRTKVDSFGIVINQIGEYVQMGYMHNRTKDYKTMEVFGVNAAACLYSRKFLEEQPFSDYLDNDLFMYYEDIDLAARAQVMGWHSYLVPKAIAYHMGSASKKRYFFARMTSRNRPLVLFKNLPFSIIKKMFKAYIKTEIKILGRYARHKDFVSLFASIVGKIQCVFLFPKFLNKRNKLKRSIDPDYEKILHLM